MTPSGHTEEARGNLVQSAVEIAVLRLLAMTDADLAAEQVREAYERGLEDAARVAEVKPRKGGRPLSGPHHAGIRRGRSEAARLIRALKSNDTNGGQP